jgi:hypothetical protein
LWRASARPGAKVAMDSRAAAIRNLALDMSILRESCPKL